MAMDLVGDLLSRLDQLNTIGAALSKERDLNSLLEGILIAAKNITQADGGTLYRMTEDGSALRFEIMRTNSLNLFLGGTTGKAINFAPLQLIDADGGFNDTMVATFAAIHDRTVNIADAYGEAGFDFSGTKAFDARTGYRSQSFLTVPMKNFDGEVIGVLQLINALEPGLGRVVTFSEADQRLVESLASQAAIALSNRQLVTQMESLFESFVQLVNTAIDEKSPYARDRFNRIPALTLMLASAVDATTDGPYASVQMTERDRYELKIAGMLHDCGKIATPVHVADKATKLQTLFDRIELISTRFEVLKRDAEIAALRQQLALRTCVDPAAETVAEQHFEAALARIDADRAFLREVNQAQSVMTDAQLSKVRDIGTRRHWRNADGVLVPFLGSDELENLSIVRGTLTAQEHDIVNHHVATTNAMLAKVHWPKHLKNVPEYVIAGRERPEGTGISQDLLRQQVPMQSRMLALADVFEALTSTGRPYRPRMKLSKALEVMVRFAKSGYVDADLFDVFMRQGVYRQFAERFLSPEQIDLPSTEHGVGDTVPDLLHPH
jgi:HD-GYP domain-containing protein (c-di-GMP phosphodiesterase class II)